MLKYFILPAVSFDFTALLLVVLFPGANFISSTKNINQIKGYFTFPLHDNIFKPYWMVI